MALEYARRGAVVVLVARRSHRLEDVAEECRRAGAADALVLPADVSEEEQCRRLVESTVQQLGRSEHRAALGWYRERGSGRKGRWGGVEGEVWDGMESGGEGGNGVWAKPRLVIKQVRWQLSAYELPDGSRPND